MYPQANMAGEGGGRAIMVMNGNLKLHGLVLQAAKVSDWLGITVSEWKMEAQ